MLPLLLLNVVLNNLGVPRWESSVAAANLTSLSSTDGTTDFVDVDFTDAAEQESAAENVVNAEVVDAEVVDAEFVDAEIDIFAGLSTPQEVALARSLWETKEVRGIYMSRYQVTGDASEQTIRQRVRYYKSQGINTIIHGVWGNGCTMYRSGVMNKTFGLSSWPNAFQDEWLDWLLDEADAQGMQVLSYFEKVIKLDRYRLIYDHAVAIIWFVPGVDRTYSAIDHYVLDVENPAVSSFFEQILVEFVQRYPTIDAVQWDDYVGYHASLPGSANRTQSLTQFVRRLRTGMKAVNPTVSFDICHHNPYWGARYFAADWEQWGADRAFIQVYNDANFHDELSYVENHEGIAISDNQLHRLNEIINNPNIQSVLIFPMTGDPETAASRVRSMIR
mgnify:CR=1 FL=1